MSKTYVTLVNDTLRQIGEDTTTTTLSASTNRFVRTLAEQVNRCRQEIWAEKRWRWAKSTSSFVTNPEYTTGTATVTTDTSTIALTTGKFLSTHLGWRFKYGSDEQAYEIITVTSSTTASLDSVYVGSSGSGSYALRKREYSLESDVDSVIAITQVDADGIGNNYHSMEIMPLIEFSLRAANPDNSDSGYPYIAVELGLDTSSNVQYLLWPTPRYRKRIDYYYWKKYTNLVSNSQQTGMPAEYDNVIHFDLLATAYEMLGQADRPVYSSAIAKKQWWMTRLRNKDGLTGSERPQVIPRIKPVSWKGH